MIFFYLRHTNLQIHILGKERQWFQHNRPNLFFHFQNKTVTIAVYINVKICIFSVSTWKRNIRSNYISFLSTSKYSTLEPFNAASENSSERNAGTVTVIHPLFRKQCHYSTLFSHYSDRITILINRNGQGTGTFSHEFTL